MSSYAIIIKKEGDRYFSYIKRVTSKQSPLFDALDEIRMGEKFTAYEIASNLDAMYSPDASDYVDDMVTICDADGEVLGQFCGDVVIIGRESNESIGLDIRRAQDILMSLHINGSPAVSSLVKDNWLSSRGVDN
jgi:hypothetical protein